MIEEFFEMMGWCEPEVKFTEEQIKEMKEEIPDAE